MIQVACLRAADQRWPGADNVGQAVMISVVFLPGPTSSPALLVGTGVVLLQAAFRYLPLLPSTSGSTGLSLGEVARTTGGAAVLPAILLEKWIRRASARLGMRHDVNGKAESS